MPQVRGTPLKGYMLQCCTFVGINGHETVIKQHTPLVVVGASWSACGEDAWCPGSCTCTALRHLCRRLDTGSWRCLRPSLSSSWLQNEGVGGRGTFLGITSGICSTSVCVYCVYFLCVYKDTYSMYIENISMYILYSYNLYVNVYIYIQNFPEIYTCMCVYLYINN